VNGPTLATDPARRAPVDQHEAAIRDEMAIGDVHPHARRFPDRTRPRSLEVYLSTLRQYVEVLGGRLEVAAVEAVVLNPLASTVARRSTRTIKEGPARTPLAPPPREGYAMAMAIARSLSEGPRRSSPRGLQRCSAGASPRALGLTTRGRLSGRARGASGSGRPRIPAGCRPSVRALIEERQPTQSEVRWQAPPCRAASQWA